MTTTGPADVVVSACGHAEAARPVLARHGFRELVCIWPAAGEPTLVRAVVPRSACFKPAFDRLPGRSRGLRLCGPVPPYRPVRAVGPPRPSCPRRPWIAYPLYLYLLERPAAALPGCSIDPGRDMLCILTLPPRWLQWP
jgi:hypothetical protein